MSSLPGLGGRVPVGRRMLVHDRARFGLTVAGVGMTVGLVLFLFTVYQGALLEGNGYVAARPVDAWVMHRNSTNLVRSVSYMQEEMAEGLRTIPGVGRVDPLLRVIASTRIRGRRATFFILGIDPRADATRPTVVAGQPTPEPGTLLVDRALAARYGLTMGDSIEVQGLTFRVGGLTSGTNALVTQFAFATLPDAQRLLGFEGIVSYLLVQATSGTTARTVTDTLRARFDELNTFTQAEFSANNVAEMRTGVLPLLWTLTVFGVVVGGVILSLLLYGGVLERREDYALLKAVGAGSRWVDGLVLRQAFFTVVCGLGAGVLVYACAALVARSVMPEIAFAAGPWTVPATVLGALVLGMLAAWLPLWKLRRVYPGEVFRP